MIASMMKKQIKRVLRIVALMFKLAIYPKNKPRAFYLMGLDSRFPNLGDQAQAAAIPLWIEKHFGMPIIQVKSNDLLDCLPVLEKAVQDADLVFMHSGGNFGDDWYETQTLRELTYASLKSKKIIQLPQTIYYSETEAGQEKLKKTQSLIKEMQNLIIFGRDFESAAFSKKHFPNAKTIAMPDMVLSLHQLVASEGLVKEKSADLKKVLLIMRNDKEGVFDLNTKQSMTTMLNKASYECILWDTDVEDSFLDHKKLEKILEYLRFINQFDAVITDRYHGLIFSVLLQLPTVVLKTHNHKLTSAFDWFSEVNYAEKVDSLESVIPALERLNGMLTFQAPHWNNKHFDLMAREVKSHFKLDEVSV